MQAYHRPQLFLGASDNRFNKKYLLRKSVKDEDASEPRRRSKPLPPFAHSRLPSKPASPCRGMSISASFRAHPLHLVSHNIVSIFQCLQCLKCSVVWSIFSPLWPVPGQQESPPHNLVLSASLTRPTYRLKSTAASSAQISNTLTAETKNLLPKANA